MSIKIIYTVCIHIRECKYTYMQKEKKCDKISCHTIVYARTYIYIPCICTDICICIYKVKYYNTLVIIKQQKRLDAHMIYIELHSREVASCSTTIVQSCEGGSPYVREITL